MTVKKLLQAEGCGPWLAQPVNPAHTSGAAWLAAVELAEVVAATIQRPVWRARFVASAAETLAENDPTVLSAHGDYIAGLITQAECQRGTPGGSAEIWGNLLQRLEAEA